MEKNIVILSKEEYDKLIKTKKEIEDNKIILSKEEYDKLIKIKKEIEDDKIILDEYNTFYGTHYSSKITYYYTKDELLKRLIEDKQKLIHKLSSINTKNELLQSNLNQLKFQIEDMTLFNY